MKSLDLNLASRYPALHTFCVKHFFFFSEFLHGNTNIYFNFPHCYTKDNIIHMGFLNGKFENDLDILSNQSVKTC